MYLTYLNFDLEIRWLKEEKETLATILKMFSNAREV